MAHLRLRIYSAQVLSWSIIPRECVTGFVLSTTEATLIIKEIGIPSLDDNFI